MEYLLGNKEIIDILSDELVMKLSKSNVLVGHKGDLTIAQVQRIIGCGRSAAYEKKYHGEYLHNGRRMIRREEFMYRRNQGLDVCL